MIHFDPSKSVAHRGLVLFFQSKNMAAKVHGGFPVNTSMKNSEIISHSDFENNLAGVFSSNP